MTDDAQLVEAAGYPVVVVAGSVTNFKITTKDDLTLAELILSARTRGREEAEPRPGFDDEAKW